MRELSYAGAINEALRQALELSEQVVVLGQMIDYKPGVFGTTTGLAERFGSERVRDFPIAESLMTSAAIGAAAAGLRPVLVHQRLDFMLYSLDAIANWLALWRFKSNGQSSAPVTIRTVVGKGWGQGPQHSKSLHAWFAHLPGLRVALPATPADAKGLLLDSILGEDPTLVIEHRGLFNMTEDVPEKPYRVRFGKAMVRRPGRDATVVALGMMVPLCLRAADRLAAEGVDVEVIDPRTIAPFDEATIYESLSKTGRLVVADPAWQTGGFAAEIVARACENVGHLLRAEPVRVCLPDSHTPTSVSLEKCYYPDEVSVAEAVRAACGSGEARVKQVA